MARANNSLPTPDSPSISTGIVEAAAFCAVRRTPAIASLRVTMSAKVKRPSRLCLMRCNSPFSALVLSALRNDTCSRSMPTGFTTKSWAPARIADTTLSMPPWAVCTITGRLRPASRSLASTPMPSSPGITRSSTMASMAGGVRGGQECDGRIAGIDGRGLIAAFLHHVFDQPAGHGIVVDNQNAGSHGVPRALQLSVSNRGTLADAD